MLGVEVPLFPILGATPTHSMYLAWFGASGRGVLQGVFSWHGSGQTPLSEPGLSGRMLGCLRTLYV